MSKDITSASASFNWRDHLKVHPAADLFPLMSEQELRELADDIRKNGLQQPMVLCHRRFTATEPAQKFLIDGRNRLDALALLGWLGPKCGDGPLKIRNKRALIDASTTCQFRAI